MRKKVYIFFCIMLLALLNGCGNLGETDPNIFDFDFTDEGTIVIQGFIDNEEEISKIIIPKEINGKEVTHIGDYAFYSCDNLVSVVLKDNIKSIGQGAFESCARLDEISFSNDIEQIGKNAFAGCGFLKNEVPEFSFESDEDGNIVITGVMESLYNLENGELVVPGEILGRHVKNIGDYAFKEFYKFDSVVLEEGIVEIGTGAFSWAGVTYVTLPNTLEKIGDFAFEANIRMESLEIPESVSYVGNSAFKDCIELKYVNMPKNLEYLGRSAFESSGVKSITLPEKLTSLEEKTFYKCSNLTEVTAVNVESIGDEAFRSSGLCTILVSDKLTDIGQNVFPQNWFGVYTVTIIAPSGSAAERYAKLWGINVNVFGGN